MIKRKICHPQRSAIIFIGFLMLNTRNYCFGIMVDCKGSVSGNIFRTKSEYAIRMRVFSDKHRECSDQMCDWQTFRRSHKNVICNFLNMLKCF